MKILCLSTYDNVGGAGRAAYRIHNELLKNNIDSTLMVKYKSVNDSTVIKSIKQKYIQNFWELLRLCGKIFEKLIINSNYRKKFTSLLFYRSKIPVDFINSFDLLILFWIADGFVSPENLKKVKIPIIWRMSDMWPFTGGCHYAGTCLLYKDNCGRCPAYSLRINNDPSRLLLNRKIQSWGKINLTIISPSSWMAGCVKSSLLFKNKRSLIIPTGVDINLFKPRDKYLSRKKLNLPIDKQLILLGAINFINDKRKGYDSLIQLQKKFSNKLVEYIIFGNNEIDIKDDQGIKTHFIGSINNDEFLVDVYSAADIFLSLSTEENLPNTVLEAMSCGLPCAAYNVGGLSDIIEHKINGYLVECFNIIDLAHGISWILEEKTRLSEFSFNAQKKIHSVFSHQNSVKQYMNLFQELTCN